ncbi:DMT family transporter [Frigidibacter sp. RF13]|uniref:DMT family transporter n=1 Tax=Frigidibacter sp. RF13 TaxID=2997340 RepID=UPI00226FDA28|nr:DMT family transporter [Frigidibacter sp. RF13]MCY1125696.1 DMT family transporter [Frigidibacter sp. RF13]
MTPDHRPIAAALWMGGSITGFCLVAVAGRALSTGLDTFEIMFYRSVVGVILVVALALATRQTEALRPRHLQTHVLRNLFHFAGQNLWLYALTLIPLAQLFALEFSYPILVALSAPFFLGERLPPRRLVAAAIGFAGILIVARPFGGAGLSIGLMAALLCAVGFAGAAVITKKLTRVTSVLAILFWLTVTQTLFGLVGAAFGGGPAWPAPPLWPWILAIGLGGLGAHLSLTKALSLAPASLVTPLDFLRLPLIGVVGMVWYSEPLDIWVFVGGAIIFAANWLNILSDTPHSRPA